MRELIADLFISLDGFASGTNEAALMEESQTEENGRVTGSTPANWRNYYAFSTQVDVEIRMPDGTTVNASPIWAFRL